MSTFEFDDGIGGRLRGTLHAPGATPGDVLTVGATHGAISPAGGGGSQPGTPQTIPPTAMFTSSQFGSDHNPGIVEAVRLDAPAGTFTQVEFAQVIQSASPLDPGIFVGVWDGTTLALLAATADLQPILDANEQAGSGQDVYIVTVPFTAPLVLASAGPVYVGLLNPGAGGAGNFTSVAEAQVSLSGPVRSGAYTIRDTHGGGSDYMTLPDPLTVDAQDNNAPNVYYFQLLA